MVVSQNGYSANDRSVVMSYVVTKTGLKMTLRVGPPGEMLASFVRWFDENIRDIDPGILDDWSYAERLISGSTDITNHASGTAADVDATKWPLGSNPEAYLTAAEIAKVRAKLLQYEGCIRWGGDYTGRKDPMHFEINKDAATVAEVWGRIKLTISDEEDDDMAGKGEEIAEVLYQGNKQTPREMTVYQRLKTAIGVIWEGTPGTPRDKTIYQRLLRIEEQDLPAIRAQLNEIIAKLPG